MKPEEYALLYCHYDNKKGNRDWKRLLKSRKMIGLDRYIALNAMNHGESRSTVVRIIAYGSPLAQTFSPLPRRILYANAVYDSVLLSLSRDNDG